MRVTYNVLRLLSQECRNFVSNFTNTTSDDVTIMEVNPNQKNPKFAKLIQSIAFLSL